MIRTIYLPCQVFYLPVTAGPARKISRLERLVLQAIHAGVSESEVTYFKDLAELFQLGHRPTLDLIGDLWHRGYVAVDVEQRLWVTDPVKRRIDNLEQLESGQVKQVRLPLMQELLSLHVLDFQRPPRFETTQIAPPAFDFGNLRRASVHEIMRALGRQLRFRFSREDEPWKVLDANLGFVPGSALQIEQTLLETRIDCTRDDEAERLIFRIVEPQNMNFRSREDIERALADLAETRGGHPFFKNLRETIGKGTVQAFVDASDVTDRLNREIGKLAGVNQGNIAKHHDDLLAETRDIKRHIENYRKRRIEVSHLSTTADHFEAFEKIIADSDHQIVIATPGLRYRAFVQFSPLIEDALEQKISVFLLWGSHRKEQLETALINELSDLKSRFRLNFWYSKLSARIQGSFLLADDTHLLVTSWRFLQFARNRDQVENEYRDLGILLTSRSASPDTSPIHESLGWSAEYHPERRIAKNIKTRFDRGEPLQQVSDDEVDSGLLDFEVELPSFKVGDNKDVQRSNIRLWRKQWQAAASHLEKALAGEEITGQWIADGRHREILWSVLRRPGRCLLILSWKIDPDVVKPVMLTAFEEWLSGGARIVIGFREEVVPSPKLARLKKKFPSTFILKRVSSTILSFPQLLLTEDLCLLSSYGFLSFAGYYDTQRAHDLPHHVGILLRGGDAVLRTLELLSTWLAKAGWIAETLARAPEPSVEHPAEDAGEEPVIIGGSPELQQLLTRLARQPDNGDSEQEQEQERARLFHAWFRDSDAAIAWGSLDALLDVELPDFVRAVASCLANRPSEESPAQRQKWLNWLVEHLWYRDSVWHRPESALRAAILREALGAPAVSRACPPRWLAALAAARCHPALLRERLMESVLRASLTDAEVRGLAAVCISAILELAEAVGVAREGLDLLKSRLPEVLRQCAARAVEFWSRTGQAVTPEIVEQWSDEDKREARAEKLTERFFEHLGRERKRKFKFALAHHAWAALFGDRGPLRELIAAVGARDVTAVRSWLEEDGSKPDALLDAATELGMKDARFVLARRERDHRIVGRYRMSYLRQIGDFLALAEEWAELHRPNGEAMDKHYRDCVLQLSRGIKKLLPELEELTASSTGFEAPLLKGLAGHLSSLVELDS